EGERGAGHLGEPGHDRQVLDIGEEPLGRRRRRREQENGGAKGSGQRLVSGFRHLRLLTSALALRTVESRAAGLDRTADRPGTGGGRARRTLVAIDLPAMLEIADLAARRRMITQRR